MALGLDLNQLSHPWEKGRTGRGGAGRGSLRTSPRVAAWTPPRLGYLLRFVERTILRWRSAPTVSRPVPLPKMPKPL